MKIQLDKVITLFNAKSDIGIKWKSVHKYVVRQGAQLDMG